MIAKFGRKYSVMVCPWIESGVFEGLRGRPDMDPMSKARFKDGIAMLKGTVAELYDFVPKDLHPLMEGHSLFMSTVSVINIDMPRT